MYKTIAVILIASSMLLTGCAGNEVTELSEQNTKTVQESNTFENEAFSISLPALYIEKDGNIQPKTEKDFPYIVFASSKEKVEIGKLSEFTEEWFQNLWTQTGPSGKFINKEIITINGKNAIKFTIQYPGRSYEDNNGYLNEYHYSILDGENLFQFWTSASDLENPGTVSSQFDEIIRTISFK